MCTLALDSITGFRSGPGLPPSRLLLQGSAQGCNSLVVVSGTALDAAGNTRFGPTGVLPDGSWTIQINSVNPALMCGERPKITLQCGDDDSSCPPVEIVPPPVLNCVIQASVCPTATLSVGNVADDCVAGQRTVTLHASLVGASGVVTAYWSFGDGGSQNSPPNTFSGSSDWDTLHAYSPGDWTPILNITYPPECARSIPLSVPIHVDPCPDPCPDLSIEVTSVGDCDSRGTREVGFRLTQPSGATTVLAILNYGDGVATEPDALPQGETIDLPSHRYLPGTYTARLTVASPAGCPGAEVKVGPLPGCGSTTPTGPSPGAPTPTGTVSVRPWYCPWLEAIMMISLILAIVTGMIAVCELESGVRALPQSSAGFWFVLGIVVVAFELLASFYLTFIGVFAAAALLWVWLCRPSLCRILEDIAWSLVWAAFLASFGAILTPICNGIAVYIVIIGAFALAVSSAVIIRKCQMQAPLSLPWLRA